MQQTFPCPNCGAPVPAGKKFCTRCGAGVGQFAQQIPPQQPPPPPYGYRPPYQQPPEPPYNRPPQGWDQQSAWGQPGPYDYPPGQYGQPDPYNQPPGWGNQYQQQYGYNNLNPRPRSGGSSSTVVLIVVIVVLLSAAAIIFAINGTSLFSSDSSPASTAPATTSPVATTPAATTTPPASTPATTTPASTTVTADALISAFTSNPSAAMKTYGDKTLTITGTVLQVSELDAYVIFGSTAVGALKMKCSFGSNSAAGIADGQTITIQGTLISWDEETEFIYLSNCSKK